MLYPLVLTITVIRYVNIQPDALRLPHWLLLVVSGNMLVGDLSMIVVSGIVTWRRHGWRVAVFASFSPVYGRLCRRRRESHTRDVLAGSAVYAVIVD